VNATAVERVAVAAWRETIAAAIARGAHFGGVWANSRDGALEWHALLVERPAHRVLVCAAGDGRVDTIVDLVPAANWDEREGHDIYGLRSTGHEPLRALVAHPARCGRCRRASTARAAPPSP
jgi:hypothetical protein